MILCVPILKHFRVYLEVKGKDFSFSDYFYYSSIKTVFSQCVNRFS